MGGQDGVVMMAVCLCSSVTRDDDSRLTRETRRDENTQGYWIDWICPGRLKAAFTEDQDKSDRNLGNQLRFY